MLATLAQAPIGTIALLRRLPWIGWIAWDIFICVAIARIHPRRIGSTFTVYLSTAERLWAGERVYNPLTLGDYLYFPASLLVYVPFTSFELVLTAAIALTIDAAFFTWACAALMPALLTRDGRPSDAVALAGVLLMVNIPAAWFNFKGIQAQVPMTAAMIAACAAMTRGRWNAASFWLFIAILMKPLALVMVLLCAPLVREMRLPLIGAVLVMVLLPFAFLDWSYLVDQYWLLGLKLWHIASVGPSEWDSRADLITMLQPLGIQMPVGVSLIIQLGAALGTLALAWRVRRAGGLRSFALAVLLLSGCYITLFGLRNEYLSFIVITPSITALALLMLVRNESDYRGWLLILAATVLGFVWNMPVNSTLKPAIVLAIYVWLSWLMTVPARWREIVEGTALLSDTGIEAVVPANGGHR